MSNRSLGEFLDPRKVLVWVTIVMGGLFLLTIQKLMSFGIFYIMAVLLPAVAYLVWTGKFDMEDIGWFFKKEGDLNFGYKGMVLGAVIGVIFFFFVSTSFTGQIMPNAVSFRGINTPLGAIGSSSDFALNTFVVAPAEENLFRGFMMTALGGSWVANIIQATTFAAYHINAYGITALAPFMMAVMFGIGTGSLRKKYGLVATTSLHASWNNSIIAKLAGQNVIWWAVIVPIIIFGLIVYWNTRNK